MSAEERGGWTRLHSLCYKRESYGRETYFWRAETLAKKYGLDCRTNLGNTPLHFACSDPEFAELALFFVSKGADVNLKNLDGETPLHYACIHSTPEVVEAMVCLPDVNVDVQDDADCTPLHWALQQSEFPVGVAKALLAAGARVDTRDEICDTPLHYAAREGMFDMYELLRSAHRGPEPYNAIGLTPFHAACETDQAEFVAKFVEKYPEEARRRTSDTLASALHVAVQGEAFDTVAALLESDVGRLQLDSLDVYAKTPFVWAFMLEAFKIVSLLENAGADCTAVSTLRLCAGDIPLYGDSDSELSDGYYRADSWGVVSPRRSASIACEAGSDRKGSRSSSEGRESCNLSDEPDVPSAWLAVDTA
mmetsp:Transcript_15952/g.62326  ORF Transcript_15952/g.62326 Transcript_15952/m.62326 type:complete len:364 (-) Transcript_15952:175-1266(-)